MKEEYVFFVFTPNEGVIFMQKKKSYAFLLIALAALLWSFDGLLRRELYTLPPITIVFWEHLIGLIIITPFILRFWKEIKKIEKKTWYIVAIVALLSGVLGTLFFTTALVKIQFIPFSVVILLQKLQPIFAITAAHLLLKEKLSRSFLGWASIAIVAGYFVTFPTLTVDFRNNREEIFAALFAILAAASWGISTALSRYGLLRIRSSLMTGLRFFGTVFVRYSTRLPFGCFRYGNSNQCNTIWVSCNHCAFNGNGGSSDLLQGPQ